MLLEQRFCALAVTEPQPSISWAPRERLFHCCFAEAFLGTFNQCDWFSFDRLVVDICGTSLRELRWCADIQWNRRDQSDDFPMRSRVSQWSALHLCLQDYYGTSVLAYEIRNPDSKDVRPTRVVAAELPIIIVESWNIWIIVIWISTISIVIWCFENIDALIIYDYCCHFSCYVAKQLTEIEVAFDLSDDISKLCEWNCGWERR